MFYLTDIAGTGLPAVDQPAEIIAAPSEGYLISFRAPCLTQQGDCIAVTTQEFDPNSLFLK